MKLENIVKLKIDLSKVNKPKDMEISPNPCWDGYEPIGLKEDGSPNFLPIKEEQSKVKEGFQIPSPEGEDEYKYISRCISAIIDEYPAEGQAYSICKAKWDGE